MEGGGGRWKEVEEKTERVHLHLGQAELKAALVLHYYLLWLYLLCTCASSITCWKRGELPSYCSRWRKRCKRSRGKPCLAPCHATGSCAYRKGVSCTTVAGWCD